MGSLATILAALTTARVGESVSRYKRNGVLFLFAAFFLVTAYIFFLIATAVWLSRAYGTIEAMIFLAVAFLVVAIAAIVAVTIFNARDRRIDQDRRRRSQAQTSLAIAAGLTIFRKNPLLMTALTLGAATLLGASTGSRRRDD